MKKCIAAICAMTMFLGAVSGLTACGGDAHEHIWNDGEITSAPTCTEFGVRTFNCTVEGCTETYTEAVDKLAHEFTGEWVEVEGGHAKKCANCEAVDTANKTNHNLAEDTEKRVDATCHSDGEKHFVCDDCGAETIEQITERPAHDFDNGEWVEVEDGHAKQCANCEAVDTANKTNHNLVEDTEKRVDATCHSDGEKHFVCNDCGATNVEYITERPAHDFDNGEWVEVEGGHAKKCANCEAVDENVIAHTWDEGEVTAQPTFWQDGEKTFTCNDCGKTKTEPVAAKTSVTYKEDFNINLEDGKQTGDWQYGTVDYKFDDNEDFTFTQFTTNNGSDAWTFTDGANVEIKDEYINADGRWAAVAFTFKADTEASVSFTFTGTIPTDGDGNEGPQSTFNCRIGLKNADGVIYGNPEFRDGAVCEYSVKKQFKAGDTIYFMIEHAGRGWTSGSLNIGIVKGA